MNQIKLIKKKMRNTIIKELEEQQIEIQIKLFHLLKEVQNNLVILMIIK